MDSLQRSSLWLSGLLFGLLTLAAGAAAHAAEIKVLSGGGMREVMENLGPKFERATGHTLALNFAALGAVINRIRGGESADVVILFQEGIDGFIMDGKAVTGDVTAIARSGIGIAVRKGATKPDISSPASLTRTLLAAKSLSFGNPAQGSASGSHFAKVLDRLGVADEMKPKTIFPPKGGSVGALVATGEAEIGVSQFQELIPIDGIEIVGPLPDTLQLTGVYSAAIMAGAKDAEAARALVKFLGTPDAVTVIKAKGLEPVTP